MQLDFDFFRRTWKHSLVKGPKVDRDLRVVGGGSRVSERTLAKNLEIMCEMVKECPGIIIGKHNKGDKYEKVGVGATTGSPVKKDCELAKYRRTKFAGVPQYHRQPYLVRLPSGERVYACSHCRSFGRPCVFLAEDEKVKEEIARDNDAKQSELLRRLIGAEPEGEAVIKDAPRSEVLDQSVDYQMNCDEDWDVMIKKARNGGIEIRG